MAGFSLKGMVQFFSAIFIFSSVFQDILAKTNEENISPVKKIAFPFPTKTHSNTIRITEAHIILKNNSTFQNHSRIHNSSNSKSQAISNSTHKNIKPKPFEGWKILENCHVDLQITMSRLSLLLLLIFFCVILSLTCVLRFCCFFCNRKAYGSSYTYHRIDAPVCNTNPDVENQTATNNDSRQGLSYGTFLKTKGNKNDDLTPLISPVQK